MQALIISTMMKLLNALMDGEIIDNIKQLVIAATDFDMEGVDKKAAVLKELHDIGGDLGEAIASLVPAVLSMAIDIVVAYLQTRQA